MLHYCKHISHRNSLKIFVATFRPFLQYEAEIFFTIYTDTWPPTTSHPGFSPRPGVRRYVDDAYVKDGVLITTHSSETQLTKYLKIDRKIILSLST